MLLIIEGSVIMVQCLMGKISRQLIIFKAYLSLTRKYAKNSSVHGAFRVIAALSSAACLLASCASSPLQSSGALPDASAAPSARPSVPPDTSAVPAAKPSAPPTSVVPPAKHDVLADAVPPPKSSAPEWTVNFDRLYPQDEYISGKGYGASRETAETAALSAISLFFIAEVRSKASSIESYSQQNGVASSSQQEESEIFVQSQADLFAVRYTDAWLNPDAEWESAAYIDRDEAWAIYEPQVRLLTAPFMSRYSAAQAESEPLRRYFQYSTLQNLHAEAQIFPMLNFAQTLHPRKATVFDEVRTAFAALDRDRDAAKTASTIAVVCVADFENRVSVAVSNAFSAQGFAVQLDENTAAYTCVVTIAENEQTTDSGTFYMPAIHITLMGASGASLFTWNRSLERVGARGADVAKRRAYTAAAAAIQESLFTDFVRDINK
jgi:hypothetical protein